MTRRQIKRKIDNAVYTFILKLMFVYPFQLMYYILKYLFLFLRWISRTVTDAIYERKTHRRKSYGYRIVGYEEIDEDEEEEASTEVENVQVEDELSKYDNLPPLPEMCQIYDLGPDLCVGVQFVSRCPDETAHIRIIGDTEFSEIYKRKVYTEKYDKSLRYFKLNDKKYYLDNRRTQPIIQNQTKIKPI